MKKITLGLSLMVAAMLILTTSVFAARLSVPGQYSTIQAAIDAAIAGDTIIVKAGTYHESLDVKSDITILGRYSKTYGYPIIDAGGGQSLMNRILSKILRLPALPSRM